MVARAGGKAEREAAKVMIGKVLLASPAAGIAPDADRGFDAAAFIEHLQQIKVQLHVAQNTSGRRSAVAGHIA